MNIPRAYPKSPHRSGVSSKYGNSVSEQQRMPYIESVGTNSETGPTVSSTHLWLAQEIKASPTVGILLGNLLGIVLGKLEEFKDGFSLCTLLGDVDNFKLGFNDKFELGVRLGTKLSFNEGSEVGSRLAVNDGSAVGSRLAVKEGIELGMELDVNEGNELGTKFGETLGVEDGFVLVKELG
eukprot:CAMPEP_0203668206 /NCGR_PEP_ID=MMETSP0090-20130426/4898_1 /ASSEMBLY_ACC=CAM_ASM_001088 /TAXON_ID=426623 /ORGANISM="Chaetoceros affinis, Strain CCMP159" /LENGTH=180 /DNA_ID=CAMNT_0050532581 /DNA_START=555 /DNA_END=1098 /DNA_ORIENTATION=+